MQNEAEKKDQFDDFQNWQDDAVPAKTQAQIYQAELFKIARRRMKQGLKKGNI
jgi:hypothetical protein